jgi:hypothetical protein
VLSGITVRLTVLIIILASVTFALVPVEVRLLRVFKRKLEGAGPNIYFAVWPLGTLTLCLVAVILALTITGVAWTVAISATILCVPFITWVVSSLWESQKR